MTKKDIVKTIAADADLTQLKVKEIVQRTFDEIIETLVRDGKIELRNFGVFKVTKRKERPARNPRTGDPVNVPEKCVVTFKPGKEMAARIRELKDVPKPGADENSESIEWPSEGNHPALPKETHVFSQSSALAAVNNASPSPPDTGPSASPKPSSFGEATSSDGSFDRFSDE